MLELPHGIFEGTQFNPQQQGSHSSGIDLGLYWVSYMSETPFDVPKCKLSGKWLNKGDSILRRGQAGGTDYEI